MTHSRAGSAPYPETVAIPDDGNTDDANSLATPIEELTDRTAYLHLRSPSWRSQTFTADGTWTAPTRTSFVILVGFGGGGGGGGGSSPAAVDSHPPGGGSGGGGALQSTQVVSVMPGSLYDIAIGAGGTGGAGGAGGSSEHVGNDGTAGNASTFSLDGGSTLASFPGGNPGKGGIVGGDSTHYVVCAGGSPTDATASNLSDSFADLNVFSRGPSCGGDALYKPSVAGAAQPASWPGGTSPQGYAGGAGGNTGGTQSSNKYPGGNGAGGGGGPAGVGGDGGGNGSAATTGTAGGAGSSAGANTGAGGGGGGGGGTGTSTNGGAGGTGGDGGSGQITVIWLEDGN